MYDTELEWIPGAVDRTTRETNITYKTLLVHVDDSEDCVHRVEAASRIARAFEARLVGAYLVHTPEMTPSVSALLPETMVNQRLADSGEAQQRAEAQFRAAATGTGLAAVEWRAPAGDPAHAITAHARGADLAVIGQPDDGAEAAFAIDLANAVILGSGRPVLVIPYIGAPELIGPAIEMLPGVTVRNVVAGPFEGLSKNDLPGQLCAFSAGLLRTEARLAAGWYDLVHSHYWLSGQVGWLAADRWNVPLLHSMHTMAKVKNASLAEGDAPEPAGRMIGEEQVVAAADRLIANTELEANDLIELYGADPERVAVVSPGVDLDLFHSTGHLGRRLARNHLGLPGNAEVLLFVGRIQPLKAPDVLLRGVARMVADHPERRERSWRYSAARAAMGWTGPRSCRSWPSSSASVTW